ncbi:MAG: YqgE/AlgH family protein, partial [Alphaproteobacteria bacterium]
MAKLDIKNNFLEGQIIVATPAIPSDSLFSKSVIYLISHNKEGAIGIVINNPMNNI